MPCPQYAMAHLESAFERSSKVFRASSYQNECRRAIPFSNVFWDSGEQDMEKWTVPSCSAVSSSWCPSSASAALTKIAADKAKESANAAANFFMRPTRQGV